MGKTYRKFGDDDNHRKKVKQDRLNEGKRLKGLKITNSDDFFGDSVDIEDKIVINKTRDETS